MSTTSIQSGLSATRINSSVGSPFITAISDNVLLLSQGGEFLLSQGGSLILSQA